MMCTSCPSSRGKGTSSWITINIICPGGLRSGNGSLSVITWQRIRRRDSAITSLYSDIGLSTYLPTHPASCPNVAPQTRTFPFYDFGSFPAERPHGPCQGYLITSYTGVYGGASLLRGWSSLHLLTTLVAYDSVLQLPDSTS